jgi:hypothetical protein
MIQDKITICVVKAHRDIWFNEHIEGDGPTVFAYKLGLEGIGRSGRILTIVPAAKSQCYQGSLPYAVNPRRRDAQFPNLGLCGAIVARLDWSPA